MDRKTIPQVTSLLDFGKLLECSLQAVRLKPALQSSNVAVAKVYLVIVNIVGWVEVAILEKNWPRKSLDKHNHFWYNIIALVSRAISFVRT
jgi:hypothetical protein